MNMLIYIYTYVYVGTGTGLEPRLPQYLSIGKWVERGTYHNAPRLVSSQISNFPTLQLSTRYLYSK